MSLSEQALFLLDLPPNILSRQNLENFSSLDHAVVASLPGMPVPVEISEVKAESSPFSVASRMNRASYDDQARAEALTQALRQIRASHAAKSSPRSNKSS